MNKKFSSKIEKIRKFEDKMSPFRQKDGRSPPIRSGMLTSAFDFQLPAQLIAQTPARERDQSRLLVMNRALGELEHRHFRDLLDYLCPGDVLVLNNSRVIRARLRGENFERRKAERFARAATDQIRVRR